MFISTNTSLALSQPVSKLSQRVIETWTQLVKSFRESGSVTRSGRPAVSPSISLAINQYVILSVNQLVRQTVNYTDSQSVSRSVS